MLPRSSGSNCDAYSMFTLTVAGLVMQFRLVLVCVLCTAGVFFTPMSARAQSSWRVIGSLPDAKVFHKAHPISAHEAIIIGGGGANTTILDGRTKTLSDGPEMLIPRGSCESIVMRSGKILVFGGTDAELGKIVEEFDPRTRLFRPIGSMTFSRSQICAAAINDEEVIVIGGRNGTGNGVKRECEIFSMMTGASTRIADFPYVTSYAKVVVTPDGHILCFSGRSGGPTSYRSAVVHEYNRQNNTWDSVGVMSRKIYYPTVTRMDNGQVFITGGAHAESNSVDDYVDNISMLIGTSFDSIGSLSVVRCGHAAVQLDADRILIMGGKNNDKSSNSTCEFLDVGTGLTSPGPTMNIPRGFFAAVRVLDDANEPVVFAISGNSSSTDNTATVEVLDLPCAAPKNLFADKSLLRVAGTARIEEDKILLTDTAEYSAGAVWYRSKLSVRQGLTTSFSFRIVNGSDKDLPDGGSEGADGVVFVVQNSAPSLLGKSGQGIGYEDIPNAVAVEFDSYLNASYSDPASSHVAVQSAKGTQIKSWHRAPYLRGMTYLAPELKATGKIYYAKVDFTTGAGIDVYLDTVPTFHLPVLSIPNSDISSLIDLDADGAAWIGLTSATGFSVERHELLSWSIEGCDALITNLDEREEMELVSPTSTPFIVPVPSSDVATLRWPNAASGAIINVYDARGMRLWTLNATSSELINGIQIPAMEMSSGLYIVQISTDVEMKSIPWIVQR